MSTTFSTTTLNNVSAAADILGHKWSAEIVHALSTEPMGFCQLQRAIGGVNPRTLSARLDSLEKYQAVSRQAFDDCTNDQYTLTVKGKDLLPIIKSMSSWGEKYTD